MSIILLLLYGLIMALLGYTSACLATISATLDRMDKK